MAECICVIQNGERFHDGHCLAFHDRPAVGYMTDCICVIQNGERFHNGHCLAFHDRPAVGYVTDPTTLAVQRGSIFGAEDHIARLWRMHRELGRLIRGNVTTDEFEAGLANALCELIDVMLEERVPAPRQIMPVTPPDPPQSDKSCSHHPT